MPEHAYEVIKAVTRPVDVEVGGKKMPFGNKGAFRVRDAGVANEIKGKYGHDVTVTKINTRQEVEKKLHPNRITSPGMPWHKYDEFGRIIREDKDDALQDRTNHKEEENNLQPDRNQNG